MKSSDTQAVNSQTLDVTNGQHHNQTYHDGFNNTRNSPGVNLMSGADIYAHNKNQYPSLPMMSPNKRSGSMDHISADLTEASRSPSKLGGISNGQGRVGIQVPTFQSPKKTARNQGTEHAVTVQGITDQLNSADCLPDVHRTNRN